MMRFLVGLLLLLLVSCVVGLKNGLGLSPQMGWNSWNHYHCGINEDLIKKTADAFVSSGLKAAGYDYVNMDDCWQVSRDSNRVIQPDPKAFPSGIQALATYVHGRGLKFGLYSDAGTHTCAGRPGSLGFEKIDADTYAEWGVDYLKYDNCNTDGTKPEVRYPVMRDALNATKRAIFYSMCEWGQDDPATWAPAVGNSWRTTGDIGDSWSSMLGNLDKNDQWAKYAAAGGWNDPDMLEVGNGGLSETESIAHFSLWCLVKSPLLIGCDVTALNNVTTTILTNREVIAINQDSLGAQGKKLTSQNNLEVWGGPLSNKAHAVILLNRGAAAASITAEWATLGLPATASYTARDLWRHADLGSVTGKFTSGVPSHGVVFVKLTPA